MLRSLLHLFYPKRCVSCEKELFLQQELLCVSCLHALPETHFHLYNDPAIKKVFYGRLKLELATALFYFEKKGPVQQLLHQLKYKGQESISAFCGHWLGAEISNIDEYRAVEVIVPVPVHPKKKRERGYNQVTQFGQVLATHLNCDFDERTLYKSFNTKTQVFKGRFNRSDEALAAFSIANRNYTHLHGKHILLVDDILTTGATLEACGLQLLQIPDIRLSIATIAIAV